MFSWLLPGTHKVRLLRCSIERDYSETRFFIVEMECLASDNAEMSIGFTYSWVVKIAGAMWSTMLRKFATAARPGMEQRFLRAIVAEDPLLIEQVMQRFSGRVVQVFVRVLQTKIGTDFSLHEWVSAPTVLV